jgi:transposase
MKKEDARKLSPEQQKEKRKIALRMRMNGREFGEIGEMVGVHPRTVQYWWQRYQAEGLKAAVDGGKRGTEEGARRTLDGDQERLIRQLISEKMPDQLKLTFALWTRGAIQALIRQRFKMDMPIRTVGEYLKRWGFTPQKPLKRAYEQNPEKVEAWLKESYPAIAQRAKAEGAEIHWGDETGVRSDCQHGRSYAPAGKTPVLRAPGSRFSTNMISTITNQGKVRFMLYRDTMTAQVLIRFLARLIRDASKKVFLILDNLKVHHSKKVAAWLETRKDLIELFFLPAYSPELNPDEYLNCDLKAQVHGSKPAKNRDELESKVRGAMMKLQNRPQRVASYFTHPKIQYAA